MIFKDDVLFLIEEYTTRFGTPPVSITGSVFPRKSDWAHVVRTLREALDTNEPIMQGVELSQAA